MAIKNILEDITAHLIDKIIEDDKNLAPLKQQRDDILAYVLNRTPAKYTTSERGILHTTLDTKYQIQEKTDLIILVHDAIRVIQTRRDTEPQNKIPGKESSFGFPHIIGAVFEESTFSVIPDVNVSLLYNGKRAEMIDQDWKNPYLTSKSTLGYFHFWPEYNEKIMESSSQIQFLLKFNHPDLEEKTVEFKLDTHQNNSITSSHIINIVLMNAKAGIDIESLIS